MSHRLRRSLVFGSLHTELVAAAIARGIYCGRVPSRRAVFRNSRRGPHQTHNGDQALHLDDHLGSKPADAYPARPSRNFHRITKPSRAVTEQKTWTSRRAGGNGGGDEASDEFGIGAVASQTRSTICGAADSVIDAAKKGYIAYTCFTAALAEVVPAWREFRHLNQPHSCGISQRRSDRLPPSASTGATPPPPPAPLDGRVQQLRARQQLLLQRGS